MKKKERKKEKKERKERRYKAIKEDSNGRKKERMWCPVMGMTHTIEEMKLKCLICSSLACVYVCVCVCVFACVCVCVCVTMRLDVRKNSDRKELKGQCKY